MIHLRPIKNIYTLHIHIVCRMGKVQCGMSLRHSGMSLRHSVTRHIKTPPHYQENLHTKYITIIYKYLYIIVKI